MTLSLHRAGPLAALVLTALTLAGCAPGPATSPAAAPGRPMVIAPGGALAGSGDLASRVTPPPAQSLFSLSNYQRASDFKALATVDGRQFGAASGEQSLLSAEREALKRCAQSSHYQGDCEIVQVGDATLTGLSEDSESRVRWGYLRRIHQQLAVTRPVQLRLPVKVLQPGSRLVDGELFLSGDFTQGGYSLLQFDGVRCSGNLDPIEREGEELRPGRDLPIGIMEYACDGGEVLRGGYVRVDAANQIFFLEDKRKERWDFIASTANAGIGQDVAAFKQLYRKIERSN